MQAFTLLGLLWYNPKTERNSAVRVDRRYLHNIMNERQIIYNILYAVFEDGTFLNAALSDALSERGTAGHSGLSARERAFVRRVSVGTVERRLTLDAVLNSFVKTKMQKTDARVRTLLRMAAYEILYMDSVPYSASVNEAVKLAARNGRGRQKGFVNGVLRNVVRFVEAEAVSRETSGNADLRNKNQVRSEKGFEILHSDEARYSIPKWIIDLWRRDYGDERAREICEAIAAGYDGARLLTVRVNTARTTAADLREMLEHEGVSCEDAGVPNALFCSFSKSNLGVESGKKQADVRAAHSLETLTAFRDGLFYVQDLSAMRVLDGIDIRSDSRVLDVCAAPGGKATLAAERLLGARAEAGKRGVVVARDLSEKKVAKIRENVARLQIPETVFRTEVRDATKLREGDIENYDLVICDLPCSGLGVLSQKTDIKYRIMENDIGNLQKLQREILQTVQMYVKEGGVLLYATCTVDRAENDENAAWFLKTFPQFELVDETQFFQTRRSDGAYRAVFRKKRER